MDIDALVLDLDTRAGLCIARSLGRAGYAVAVAARDGRASGLTSRYVSRRIVLPDPAVDFHDHTNALLDALASQRPDAALPSIDSSVEVLHTNRDAVGRFTAPALGSFEAVEIALSKERTIEIARSLGVPVPRSTRVENLAELEAAVADTGLPCVLKPDRSWRPSEAGGERLSPSIVRDAEEARRVGAGLVRGDAPVLVQEFAVGGRETIKLFRERTDERSCGWRCSSTVPGLPWAGHRSCAARSALRWTFSIMPSGSSPRSVSTATRRWSSGEMRAAGLC